METARLNTEQRNPRSAHWGEMTVGAAVSLMNQEDHKVVASIEAAIPDIVAAVNLAVESLRQDGRLIYLGAGTSGRIGVLDAVECRPTFGAAGNAIVGIIAGGDGAVFEAVEGAEDSAEGGRNDLIELGLTSRDTVVGIAASGRTPYVAGALAYARQLGARTISIANNPDSPISRLADVAIELDTGPEVLTGSTRLKAGSAQKMVLNMLSTISMTRLGTVHQNLMVDLTPTNTKLFDRAARIICQVTGADDETARRYLGAAGNSVKTAIVMIQSEVGKAEAEELLRRNDGFVGRTNVQGGPGDE
jgi:N-acetylmuramic acid 6-phosphate etherase